jgi:hypothetical protein
MRLAQHPPGGYDLRVHSSNKPELMSRLLVATSAIAFAVVLPSLPAASMSESISSSATHGPMLAQDEGTSDEDAIPSDQVDKYIAVYSAMQKNHSLSVEQAASKQGLTVDQFRALEDKIERNPVVHQRVLDALKASASSGKGASSPGASKSHD